MSTFVRDNHIPNAYSIHGPFLYEIQPHYISSEFEKAFYLPMGSDDREHFNGLPINIDFGVNVL